MPTQEFVCDITTQRVLHSKTPRRDQNPVLAISSFGLIKTTRHAIIVTAKLPRARLSSGRSNESVGHISRSSVSFTAKHPEETRTRFSQSLPSGRSRTRATRSSSRQNSREPGSLRADQMKAWATFHARSVFTAKHPEKTVLEISSFAPVR